MKTHSRLARIAFCLIFFSAIGLAADKPNGAELYQQKCQMCHGADGKGFAALKTPDFTDSKWQTSRTDKQIADTIKNGKPNTAMPAFGAQLKDDEIQALLRQVRSWNSDKNADREKKK